jgi:Mg/Co/Ni transporter MgtE
MANWDSYSNYINDGDLEQLASNITAEDIGQLAGNLNKEDIVKLAGNMTTEDIGKLTSNMTTEDIGKLTSNMTTEDIGKLAGKVNKEDLVKLAGKVNKEDIGKLAGKVNKEDLVKLAGKVNKEDLVKLAGKVNKEDLVKLAGKVNKEDLVKLAGKVNKEDLVKLAGNMNKEDLVKLASNMNKEDLVKLAGKVNKEDLVKLASNMNKEDLVKLASKVNISNLASNVSKEDIIRLASNVNKADIIKLVSKISKEDLIKLASNMNKEDIVNLVGRVNKEDLSKLVSKINKEDIAILLSKVNKKDIQNLGNQLQNYNIADLEKYSKSLDSNTADTITSAIKKLNVDDIDKYKQYFKLLNAGDYNISELRKYASQLSINDIENIKLEMKKYISGSNVKDILLYQNIISKIKTNYIDVDNFNSIEVLLLISSINSLINNGRIDIDMIDMVNIVNQSPIQLIKEFDKETQTKLVSLIAKIKANDSLSPEDMKGAISKNLSSNDLNVLKKIMDKSIQKNPKLEQKYSKIKDIITEKQIGKLSEISKANIKNNGNLKSIVQAAVNKNPEIRNNAAYKKIVNKLEDGDFKDIDSLDGDDFKTIRNLANMEVQEINKEDKIKLLKDLNQLIEQEETRPFDSQTTINEYKKEVRENSNQSWIQNQLNSQQDILKQNEMDIDENNQNAAIDQMVDALSEENAKYKNNKAAEKKILNKKRKEKESKLEKNEKEWNQAYGEYAAEKKEDQIAQIVNINENIERNTTNENKKACSLILKNVNMLEELIQETKKELNNLKEQQAICTYQMNELGCSNMDELSKKKKDTKLQYETIKTERLQNQSDFNKNNCKENKRCYKTNIESRDFATVNDFKEYEKKYERCVNPYKNKCSCILNDLKKSQVITESEINKITQYTQNRESFTNIKTRSTIMQPMTNTIYLIGGGLLLTFLLVKMR